MARICWAALLLEQKVCSGTICYHLPAKICLGFAQNWRIYSSVLVNMVNSDCGSGVPAAGVGARTYYLNRSQPPLLSAMVRIVYGATEDAALLRSALPVTLPGPRSSSPGTTSRAPRLVTGVTSDGASAPRRGLPEQTHDYCETALVHSPAAQSSFVQHHMNTTKTLGDRHFCGNDNEPKRTSGTFCSSVEY